MATPARPALALRWRWLLPVALAVLVFHFTPFGEKLDHEFFDFSSRLPLRTPPLPENSALVLMNDDTMKFLSGRGLGTWPPPRTVFVALIAGLERAGASRIVMDFIFLDNSRDAGEDAFLGGLAAATPSVVLGRMPNQPPVFWDDDFQKAHPQFFATPRMGNVEAQPDRDQVMRTYAGSGMLAHAAFTTPPASEGGLLRWHGGLKQIETRGVPVLPASGFILEGLRMLPNLTKATTDFVPEEFARALAAEPALKGRGLDDVRGRTVFVGANAAGTYDQKRFPIGRLEPGVLLHWTAWANLTSGGFIRALPRWSALVLAALMVAGLAVAGARQTGGVIGPIIAAGSVAVATAAAAYAGISAGFYFPPATPVIAAGFTLLGVVVENFWIERRRRHEVQTMFGSYVDAEIVELLVRDPNAIRLGGERREATVFFCDLAGFTDLSEQVTAEELLHLINGYLQETSDCLMEHGAYVDKYIGDAVMAVFGAPKPLPNHALAACRAALGAQRILAARNIELAKTHGRTLGMRIGVNTGSMIVGNVGSDRKKNYTVLGDPVNLASRLEAANKEFGTGILLGETTAALVRDHLAVRPLTGLKVKGKNIAVHVAELVGEFADLTPEQKNFLAVYGEGHALYTARRFAEAAVAFERASTLAPDDSMTKNLLADARQLAATPPPDDWQPVLKLTSK